MNTATQVDLATVARQHHALSDPTRLKIMEMLAGGEQCVCELTSLLDAGQSRLSFHLKALREAGLVRPRRSGRWMYYSVDRVGIADTQAYLLGLAERTASLPVVESGCAVDDGCCG